MGRQVSIRFAESRDATALASIHVKARQTAYQGILSEALQQELSVDDRESSRRRRLADESIAPRVAEQGGKASGFVAGGKRRATDVLHPAAET
jgi:hypothetical protein